MSSPDESLDPDFDAQLRGLFVEAEQAMEGRTAAARRAEEEKDTQRQEDDRALRSYLSVPQMLKPVVLGLQAVTRAMGENALLLTKLDKVADNAASAQGAMPQVISELQGMLDQKNKVNARMFDAMHEELKGYKDSFLLETVHKPVIRDLVSLYDDLIEIHQQLQESIALAVSAEGAASTALLERLRRMEINLEHKCEFILEVLARIEVTLIPIGTGRLDKRTQRAVSVEMAEHPDEDSHVVRTLKRGFFWKERVLRAEEVVTKKWKQGIPPTPATPPNS
jgi:molecular chaperone GrpE (heat shock protein)